MNRYRRKHLSGPAPAGSTWWAPLDRDWWIAILFAVGSILFALGALPGYTRHVGTETDSATFFAGSVFFTAAAFLSYREAADAGMIAVPGRRPPRVLVFEPARIDWWAAAIQLVGTVCFNVSTGDALFTNLTARVQDQVIWMPDVVGSACFLVSSALSWGEVCHGIAAWKPRSWSWWITGANLLGSIAFGVSAIASYVSPQTGHLDDAERANLGTFAGALCFLAGAILLLPERTREREDKPGRRPGQPAR